MGEQQCSGCGKMITWKKEEIQPKECPDCGEETWPTGIKGCLWIIFAALVGVAVILRGCAVFF